MERERNLKILWRSRQLKDYCSLLLDEARELRKEAVALRVQAKSIRERYSKIQEPMQRSEGQRPTPPA